MFGEKFHQLHAAQRQLLRLLNNLEKRIHQKQREPTISKPLYIFCFELQENSRLGFIEPFTRGSHCFWCIAGPGYPNLVPRILENLN